MNRSLRCSRLVGVPVGVSARLSANGPWFDGNEARPGGGRFRPVSRGKTVGRHDVRDRREQLPALEFLEERPQITVFSTSHLLLPELSGLDRIMTLPIRPGQGMIRRPTTVLRESMLRRWRTAVSRYCLTVWL